MSKVEIRMTFDEGPAGGKDAVRAVKGVDLSLALYDIREHFIKEMNGDTSQAFTSEQVLAIINEAVTAFQVQDCLEFI